MGYGRRREPPRLLSLLAIVKRRATTGTSPTRSSDFSVSPRYRLERKLGSGSAATAIDSVGRRVLYRFTGRQDSATRLPREIPGWGPRRPLELERVLEKALQMPPQRRFTSAREFREALVVALGAS